MVLSNFYLSIMNRLLEIKDSSNRCLITYIDLWNSQTDTEEELPFSLPAVFIDINPSDTMTLGNRKQVSDLTFSLRVVSEVYGEHSSREDEPLRNNALVHLDLLDSISEKLQNFAATGTNSIDRRSIELDSTFTDLYQHKLTFTCQLTDTALMLKKVHREPSTIVIPNIP